MEEPELKITAEPAGARQVRLTIEVPEERVQQEMQRAARRIAREANIPGFRKGKAPYRIIVQRYGEDMIRREAAEALVGLVYLEALRREEIIPYAPATLLEREAAPLRFTFIVPLPPVVELGDYRSLRIKPPRAQVTKEEVEEVLEQLRQENAVLTPVEDRAAQAGDVLVIGVEGRAEDGTVFLRDEEIEILLDPGSDRPVPGFHQALEGMVVGEERTFRLRIPDGQPYEEGDFSVRLIRLFERVLPDLDDDLARTVGGFDSLKALREDTKDRLRRRKRRAAEEEYVQQVIQAVVEQARVEYPPDTVEEELDELVERLERRVQQELRMSLPDYLRVVDKDDEQLREELRSQAEERIRRTLVLAKVVEVEGLEVSEEEVDRHIAELSRSWGDRADEARERLQTEAIRRVLSNDLLMEKVTERLVAIARGELEPEAGSKEG
ncbi:MAG TPA: trigger factor [Anaerolineales bacterium]|nr:trigger factor [Anaerolineales bacterium]